MDTVSHILAPQRSSYCLITMLQVIRVIKQATWYYCMFLGSHIMIFNMYEFLNVILTSEKGLKSIYACYAILK